MDPSSDQPSNEDPQTPLLADSAAEQLSRRLVALERERNRVRPEDWKTLFRQIRTLAERLAAHPFIRGDLEAETRLDRILLAPDLEEFDKRVDHLAAYVEGKLAYNAAVTAAETGQQPADIPRLRATVPSAPGLARLEAAAGPSGSDFEMDNDPPGGGASGSGHPPPRRGVLRL